MPRPPKAFRSFESALNESSKVATQTVTSVNSLMAA
jgi:hypothetical protein